MGGGKPVDDLSPAGSSPIAPPPGRPRGVPAPQRDCRAHVERRCGGPLREGPRHSPSTTGECVSKWPPRSSRSGESSCSGDARSPSCDASAMGDTSLCPDMWRSAVQVERRADAHAEQRSLCPDMCRSAVQVERRADAHLSLIHI